jgi:hypothetical protein
MSLMDRLFGKKADGGAAKNATTGKNNTGYACREGNHEHGSDR